MQEASCAPLPPLCIAAYYGSADVVKLLLERGAKQESDEQCSQFIFRKPPLLAAAQGYADIVRVLLDDSLCHLNVADDCGISLMHYAVLYSNSDVVEALLATGKVKLTMPERFVSKAFEFACKLKDAKTIEAFLKHAQLLDPYDVESGLINGICDGLEDASFAYLKLIMPRFPNMRMEAKCAVLHWEAGQGSVQSVKCLLKHCNIDAKFQRGGNDDGPKYGRPVPIWKATELLTMKNDVLFTIAKELLEYDFDADQVPQPDKPTALSRAIFGFNEQLASLLLAYGADILHTSHVGTILHVLALAHIHMPDILERAIQGGVDVSALNHSGHISRGN